MHDVAILLFNALAAYLLGAVPFAFLFARVRGVDIRRVGSGNVGATNVFRCVGRPWGILTFAADLSKGALAATLVPRLLHGTSVSFPPEIPFIVCGISSIAGHNWPVFLGFRGGKGVATSAGVLLGLTPAAAGIGLLCWIAVFTVSRYVSAASISAALAVAGAAWVPGLRQGRVLPPTLTVLAAMVIFRHRSNIRRLLNGSENRAAFHRTAAQHGRGTPGKSAAEKDRHA